MTFLDAANSIWDWSSFDWANKVDTIWKTTICQKKTDGYLEQYIKMVLSWVVMSRIVIAHLYTITYIANFYSIITWRRAKMLLPWLAMSAFKNFVLESIVLIVIALLYIEGNLSGFLFSTAVFDKIITMAIAAHNWNTINAFYVKLKERDKRNVKRKKRLTTLSAPFNVIVGMDMKRSNLDESIRKRRKILSLPNLNYSLTYSIIDPDDGQKIRECKSLTILSSVDSQQFESRCHSVNPNDLYLPIADKVLKIIDFTYNDTNKAISEYEFDDEISKDSISEVIHVVASESDEVDSKTSTCVCMPDTSENDVTTSVEESINVHPSRKEKNSEDNLVESHLEWSRQWILGNMLKAHRNVGVKETETEYDFQRTYDEKCCQWSSDEEVESERNDKTKKTEDQYCQWLLEDEMKGNVNEESAILQLECMQILNSTINTVFLEFESRFEVENQRKNNTAAKNLKNVQTQTNKDNIYKASVTQVSPNDLSLMQYNSYHMKMLMDLSTKENMLETTQDREKKELEALKVYNALTLWKYKEEKDKMSLNSMKALTSNQPKINTSKKITYNLKTFLSSREMFDNSQIGRDLDRSRASIDIPGLSLINQSCKQLKFNNMEINILKANGETRLNPNSSISTSQEISNSNKFIDLKKKIRNIDWSLSSYYLNNSDKIITQKSINIAAEESTTDIIDDYDTVSLLQSAFSFDSHENIRGFYLGPASSDFYSISEQIPNVFHEIIKTARIKVITYDFSNYPSTREEDFGEAYLQNWRTITENCKNELPNNDTKEATNILDCQDLKVVEGTNDTIIDNGNNYSHTEGEKRLHYFDDDSDGSDLSFSIEDYFPTYIGKSDSLSDLSNRTNMSEFEADVFACSSTSSQLIL